MKVINLFGQQQSIGTYDDFFCTKKYKSIHEAYEANDFVKGNFVIDDKNIIYIEIFNVSIPDDKKYHKLIYQNCKAGLDSLDDNIAFDIAKKIL